MKYEPIGLYIFRYAVGMGLLFFMAMLYWSSEVLEHDIKFLQTQLIEVKSEIQSAKAQAQEDHEDLLELLIQQAPRVRLDSPTVPVTENRMETTDRPHMDTRYPNLLTEDYYYSQVLPKALPDGFKPKGVFRTAEITRPPHLLPFAGEASTFSLRSLCMASLSSFHIGKYETATPSLAIKVEEKIAEGGGKEYWIHLREDVFWHSLRQKHFPETKLAPHFTRKYSVTAHDFKFYLDAILNSNLQMPGAISLRNYFGDVEEVRVLDNLTFVVRWKSENIEGKRESKYAAKQLTLGLRPLPCFVFKYFSDGKKIIEEDGEETYRMSSVWAQQIPDHWARQVIVGCGPWIFDSISDERAVFRRNPDYFHPYRALVAKQEVYFRGSEDAIWQDFKVGKIDTYAIHPTKLSELEKFLSSDIYKEQVQEGKKIQKIEYLSASFNYVGWNLKREFFENRNVRFALTLAIDRQRIVNQYQKGKAKETTSSFFYHSPSYDQSVKAYPFDPFRAKQLLLEEGWLDTDGDGILDKEINGKRVPFRFSLTYYVKNPSTKANCEYIRTALLEIGIDCQLNGTDITELVKVFEEKDFDAIYFGWTYGTPPEEPKQLWHSAGANKKGSSNAIGFENSEIDRIIERLRFEDEYDKRLDLYHRFHRILYFELPYTFLYMPQAVFLYRDTVKNVFIPADEQTLIPGANITSPNFSLFWLERS